MAEENMIKWDIDADGIVTLTMDDPDQSANTMNARFQRDLGPIVDRLVTEKELISGVIVTSAKKTFLAGGDLNQLGNAHLQDAAWLESQADAVKANLRRLETLGVPVVAAINGAALGGGLELALACHNRVVLDTKGSSLGLSEATLGLLPGGGGVTRTVRMFGLQKALMEVLLQGQRRKPPAALEMGLVDELVQTREAMFAAARTWIKANPRAVQPWDVEGYRIPGGDPRQRQIRGRASGFSGQPTQASQGCPDASPQIHHVGDRRGLSS